MNITYRFGISLLLLPLVLMLTTCSKDNVIPAYIHIESFTVVGSTSLFGSTSNKISDAWVYDDVGNLQGVYELPATFPIRKAGITKLRIIAGIKVNGVAATRIIYPFYTDTIMTLNLVPAKIDTIKPQISYFPQTKFAFGPVDFETGLPFTGLAFTTDPTDVFEGHASAKMIVDSLDPEIAVSSGLGFVVPYNTASTFLELNYKNDAPFTASLQVNISGTDSLVPLVTMNPQTTWNKIYINLTPTISQSRGDNYHLLFSVSKGTSYPSPNIYLDNIKVLYFEP